MSRSKSYPTKRLSIERLENRCMLAAGNVTASVSGGNLFLKGDTLTDQILVTGNGSGSFTISDQGNGTTINGMSSVTKTGVTGDVNVKFLDAANDRVDVESAPSRTPFRGS